MDECRVISHIPHKHTHVHLICQSMQNLYAELLCVLVIRASETLSFPLSVAVCSISASSEISHRCLNKKRVIHFFFNETEQTYGNTSGGVPWEICHKRWIILHKWKVENRAVSARGGRETRGGRDEGTEDGWDQMEHSEQASVKRLHRCVCLCRDAMCFGKRIVDGGRDTRREQFMVVFLDAVV